MVSLDAVGDRLAGRGAAAIVRVKPCRQLPCAGRVGMVWSC